VLLKDVLQERVGKEREIADGAVGFTSILRFLWANRPVARLVRSPAFAALAPEALLQVKVQFAEDDFGTFWASLAEGRILEEMLKNKRLENSQISVKKDCPLNFKKGT
jgi:hypothetical protein